MERKIVYIVSAMYYPNGMAKVLTDKINYLAEHTSYQVYMVETERKDLPAWYSVSPKVHRMNFDLNFDELDVKPLYIKLLKYGARQRLFRKKLSAYLMEIKPDITISTMRREINFLNDIDDGSIKIGEIHFNRGSYRQFNKRYLPGFVNKCISNYWMDSLIKEVKKLDVFIVLSHEDRQAWPEIDRIRVIYNPLLHIPEQVSDCSSKKVIAVGRYTWQKGFDLLIEAWKYVAEEYKDWILNIYGSGDKASFVKLAEEKGVSDSLFCHGPVKEVDEKYRESSIFVLSSRFEGFGMVITEAMSNGLPVVSFACPCGPRDIITEGKDGFLVEPGNAKELAQKIIRLIGDEQARREMGTNGRNGIERFKMDTVMKQWIALFEELICQKKNSN